MSSYRPSFACKAARSAALLGIFALSASSAHAQVNLTADYTGLGTVYQDAAGLLYNAAGAGRVDVTAAFKADITSAFTTFSNAIRLPWNETIAFSLANLGAGTVGDSSILTIDANGRPATSQVRFNMQNGFNYFIDPTPNDNSEFNMSTSNALLGGGLVNNRQFGEAIAGGAAAGRWDFLTLVLHETEHSLGISNGQASGFTRFLDLVGPVGAAGDPPRTLVIPSTLSGLASNFNMTVAPDTSHFVGSPVGNSTFGYMTTADPGWQSAQRALPTGLDILAVCQTEGCTAAQAILPSTPEPGVYPMGALLALSGIGLLRRRRKTKR